MTVGFWPNCDIPGEDELREMCPLLRERADTPKNLPKRLLGALIGCLRTYKPVVELLVFWDWWQQLQTPVELAPFRRAIRIVIGRWTEVISLI